VIKLTKNISSLNKIYGFKILILITLLKSEKNDLNIKYDISGKQEKIFSEES
jgi:hypothetical protein